MQKHLLRGQLLQVKFLNQNVAGRTNYLEDDMLLKQGWKNLD